MKSHRISHIWAIALMISLNCWLLTIKTTKINILGPGDFLGIVSKLPIYFWMSIVFCISSFIIACMRGTSKQTLSSTFFLTVILFATQIFIEPNGRHPVAYAAVGPCQSILEGIYNSKEYNIPWLSFPYHAFIGFPLFVAIIGKTTLLELNTIIKIFPPLAVINLIMIIYCLYKTINKSRFLYEIGTVIFMSILVWHIFMVAELLTYILVPTFLLVFLRYMSGQYKKIESPIILIIIIFSVTITHVLASIILLCFLAIHNVYLLCRKKELPYILLFIGGTVFVSWLIYVSNVFFEKALYMSFKSFSSFAKWIDDITVQGKSVAINTFERQIKTYTVIIPFAIISALGGISTLISLKSRQVNKQMVLGCWFTASVLVLFIPYGGDFSLTRVGFFIVLSASYLAVSLLERYKFIAFALCVVFVFIHPVAYSGSKINLVPDSELVGAKFFTSVTDKYTLIFSQSNGGIIFFSDPGRAFITPVYSLWYPPLREGFDEKWDYKYIIHTKRDHSGLIEYLGEDPVEKFVHENNGLDYIYSNGAYWVNYRPVFGKAR